MSGAEGTTEYIGATSGPRFLSIKAVAEELAVGEPSVRALIKTGDLPAIQIGGRGIWRIERGKLEEYIANAYVRARTEIERGDIEAASEGTEN